LYDNPDTPTFEEIYDSYAGRILNLAYRFAGNEEVARDLTQDIFVKVYENLDRFEHKSHVYTWIYRIAVNHISNHMKRERRYKWISLMDQKVSDVIREDRLDPKYWGRTTTVSSEQKLEAAERANLVWTTIQKFPPKYQIPLVLHHYEDMSYKDIAETLGISMSAVESRIHRAKKRLIKELEPWLDRV
jgi:RNA polymerase sigma-70 factor (ECF subfamily)